MRVEPLIAIAADFLATGHGWLLQPLDGDQRSVTRADSPAELIEAVAAREAADPPRWVWPATAGVYPLLVRAGVRVGRCHDLGHAESLLLAHEARWDQLAKRNQDGGSGSTAPGAARGGAGQPSLFDEPALRHEGPAGVHLAELVAQLSDQEQRIARAAQTSPGIRLLIAAESAGTLAAVEMGHTGLPWDERVHDRILAELLGARPAGTARPALLQALAEQVATALDDPRVNLDSPIELLRSLRRAGLPVTSTGRGELRRHDHPAVPLLRRYKELARLWTANGWAWRDAWVRDGRFHPEYLPAGVVSGRWATRGGGALQIPKAIRAAVCAPPDRVLVVADAGQLEPRVLAAMSGDPGMVAATRAGDLYAALASQALGRSDARAETKVALLAAMYGGGSGSAALAALRHRFPRALSVLEDAARAGEDGASVKSILGRVCPPADPGWLDGLPDTGAGARTRARGRFTRNFVVQASAADWAAVLVAGLRTRLANLGADGDRPAQLVFFQHDEVIVEAPTEQADAVVAAVTAAGDDATRRVLGDVGVRVPLDAVPVASYAEKG